MTLLVDKQWRIQGDTRDAFFSSSCSFPKKFLSNISVCAFLWGLYPRPLEILDPPLISQVHNDQSQSNDNSVPRITLAILIYLNTEKNDDPKQLVFHNDVLLFVKA